MHEGVSNAESCHRLLSLARSVCCVILDGEVHFQLQAPWCAEGGGPVLHPRSIPESCPRLHQGVFLFAIAQSCAVLAGAYLIG